MALAHVTLNQLPEGWQDHTHDTVDEGLVVPFTWADVTNGAIWIGARQMIREVCIAIDSPFLAENTMTVGTADAHALLMPAAKLFPTRIGRYETSPAVRLPQTTHLYLFVGGAVTQGSGTAWIW